MTSIDYLTLEVDDPAAAEQFYTKAFGLDSRVRFRASDAPTSGFRGFHISLIASQPANVQALFDAAVAAGATTLKPTEKGMWGFGGVVRAPDGTIWKLATSNKKDTGPATRDIDEIVLLLGVDDVSATKRFYVDRGLVVGKSFGKYVDFSMPSELIGFGLLGRKALAKDAGVSPDGSGSHRLVIAGDADAFSDPDGFVWEPSA